MSVAKVGELRERLRAPNLLARSLEEDRFIPNNRLPLVLYRRVIRLPARDPARLLEALFEQNGWTGTWRNGVYRYHHYHSVAHEVLGVFRGAATVQFGGERGLTLHFSAGDVVVIPAGVAHKNLGDSSDFGVVGAYPDGQEPDMCYGQPGERPQSDRRIARVSRPQKDPLFGANGPLLGEWSRVVPE